MNAPLSEAAARAAGALREAAASGTPCSPIRDILGDGATAADAYAVQEINTAHGLAAGRRLVGRKIGLTSPAVQRQLGVGEPDYGMLFADMAYGEDEPIPPGAVLQPKVEAEIALVLDRDLDDRQTTVADVIRATAYALPAVEIVGSRIASWDIRLADTIADNASSGLYVLGGPARRLDGLDLRGCQAEMRRGGEVVSTGRGADCLGSPLQAAVWLARRMVSAGRPLRAGDVVLTGALGPMVAAAPGDVFDATILGVGAVRVLFSST